MKCGARLKGFRAETPKAKKKKLRFCVISGHLRWGGARGLGCGVGTTVFGHFLVLVSLLLAVFCVQNLGLHDRSMHFKIGVGDLTLHRFVIWISAKNAFCKTSVPMFLGILWSESCSVGLVWCGDYSFWSFPCFGFAPFGGFLRAKPWVA